MGALWGEQQEDEWCSDHNNRDEHVHLRDCSAMPLWLLYLWASHESRQWSWQKEFLQFLSFLNVILFQLVPNALTFLIAKSARRIVFCWLPWKPHCHPNCWVPSPKVNGLSDWKTLFMQIICSSELSCLCWCQYGIQHTDVTRTTHVNVLRLLAATHTSLTQHRSIALCLNNGSHDYSLPVWLSSSVSKLSIWALGG